MFVTAYDQYAVQAFAQGALGLPGEAGGAGAAGRDGGAPRRERLQAAQPAPNTEALLQQLAAQLAQLRAARLRRRCAGFARRSDRPLRLIPVDDIDYLRSDAKYTLIAWRDDAGQPGEALVRTAR